VVHLDEACLGNGMEPPNPGGAGGLVEAPRRSGVARRDYFVCSPDTTNNRMALTSAIQALRLLGAGGRRLRLELVSDSQYLVKGMTEWLPGWRARGWRRKAGAIENLELWQELSALAEAHEVTWRWVEGHAGDPKNEYANFLAQRAAREQLDSNGLVGSGFEAWLEAERLKGRYADFDPGSRS
jgi:ribonuclease HI